MKKIVYIRYIMVALFGLLFWSCEEKPTLFNEDDGLYFGTKDTLISYSFAKYPKLVEDTVMVPIQVLGNAAAIDRIIPVEIINQTNEGSSPAVEGVHFKLVGSTKIEANQVTGTLPVVVYRTPDLEAGKVVSFTLYLKTNEAFPVAGIALKRKQTISLAYMQRPANWGEFTGSITGFFAGYKDNFGTWTPTKYKLILDALYDPLTASTITEFPGSRFTPPIIYNQYVAIVRNYIKVNYPGNYGAAGAVLTDPDNNDMPIQVGPANY